jgi:hypothetical protein
VTALLRVDLVIVAAAIGAGIHGALVPEHFDERTGAGAGFVAAAVLLAPLAIALTLRPTSRVVICAAAVVFAALLGSYALAVTSGVPVLHPEVEPVNGLALFTKAVEAAGLAAASTLLWRRPPGVALSPTERNLTWTSHGLHARFRSS